MPCVQAMHCVYGFVHPSDWYALSIASKLFRNLLRQFIQQIQRDVSQGKETRGAITILHTAECAAPPIPRLDFEYITSNVHWRFASIFLTSCQCTHCGSQDACGCCAQSGYHYKITTDGVARLNKPIDDIVRIIECNEHCQCQSDPARCRNRVTQCTDPMHFYLQFDVGTHWGLFTFSAIAKHQFVIEFVGEVLNRHEIEHRSGKKYMLTVKEMHRDGETLNSITIDPLRCGNIARFINHSCSPNLVPQLVYSATDIPRICLFAITDIQPGDQLTFH